MFKNLKVIKDALKECFSLVGDIRVINAEISIEIDKYLENYGNISSDLNLYLNEAAERNKDISFLNNSKSVNSSSFSFTSGSTSDSIKDFTIDSYGGYSSLTSEITSISNYTRVKNSDLILTYTFDDTVELNSLTFSFTDSNGDPLIPVQILLGDTENGVSIYEPWMRKIQRSSLAKDLLNDFSFTIASTKIVTFIFERSYSNSTNVSFLRKKYLTEGSIIFTLPYSGFKNFSIFKNEFTDYVELDYYYSIDDGISWLPLYFKDNNNKETTLARILLEKNYTGGGLQIKILRGSPKKDLVKKESEVTTELIDLTNSKVNDVCYTINVPTDATQVSLVVDAEIYSLFKDLVERTVDDLFLINFDKFITLTDIDALKTLKLKNQNSFEIFDSDITPTFYKTSDGKIYIPKCFADKELHIVYNSIVENVIISETDFTPVLFNLDFNFGS